MLEFALMVLGFVVLVSSGRAMYVDAHRQTDWRWFLVGIDSLCVLAGIVIVIIGFRIE